MALSPRPRLILGLLASLTFGCTESQQGLPSASGLLDSLGPGGGGGAVDVIGGGGSDLSLGFDPGGWTSEEVAPVDAGPKPGEFGWPCTENKECSSGFCVESAQGPVCTQTCVDTCPDDWKCKEVANITSDPIFLCVVGTSNLCRPCHIHADCGGGTVDKPNLCLSLGELGSFCGRDCSVDPQCPESFSCVTIPQDGGKVAKQCVPNGGECPCLAQYNGLTTRCTLENAYGACTGERVCDGPAGAWTACDASAPAPEICDGEDNDCNGLADDNLPAEPCAQSNEYGTCQGKLVCTNAETVCDARIPTQEFCDLEDNDCDGEIDEGFGASQCGVGVCEHVVSGCEVGGQGVCDPFLGASPELCDKLDNDCDGATDELDDLGSETCGEGVCHHTVPKCLDGVPQVCQPYQGQGAEVCDGLDNDCNGVTDDFWLDQKGQPCDGNDPDKCKGGIWTCKEDGTGLACAGDDENHVETCNNKDDDCNGVTDDGLGETTCGVGVCYHTVPNCQAGKQTTCNPLEGVQATDVPDPDFVDSNCDGIDGDESKAIFVNGNGGKDSWPGTKSQPVATIQQALTLSSSGGKNHIYVSQGTYNGQVSLKNGVSLFGGYNAAAGWSRGAGNTTRITGSVQPVVGVNIGAATIVARFEITGSNNGADSGSSYGVYLRASSGVTLRHCVIQAGNGGPGITGTPGSPGDPGSPGGSGVPGCEDGGSLFCSSCNRPGAGSGGYSKCGGTGGGGGLSAKGGGTGSNGKPGSGGAPGGYGGTAGKNGTSGQPGQSGGGGTQGQAGGSIGAIDSGGYTVASGGDGGGGKVGAGGGGGGGGGGDDPAFAECDTWGGTGGGGGGGGCGGVGGQHGRGGGGSFAVYIYGGTPTIENCTLKTGSGGSGGWGGQGGSGGPGGPGSPGGTGGDQDATSGGAGGKGGSGGPGGHGGGGGGGPSIAVLCGNGAAPKLTSVDWDLGSPGSGGGSSGLSGQTGKKLNTYGCN